MSDIFIGIAIGWSAAIVSVWLVALLVEPRRTRQQVSDLAWTQRGAYHGEPPQGGTGIVWPARNSTQQER